MAPAYRVGMHKHLIAVALAMAASPVAAVPPLPAGAPPAPPPRMLVEIRIDGFSIDLLDRYRPHFTGGFARLAGGTVFTNMTTPASGASESLAEAVEDVSPGSLTVVVAGDPATAAALGGPETDQRWSWQGSHFASALPRSVPQTVAQTNKAVAAMIQAAQPPLVPPPACAEANAQGAGARFGRAAGDTQAYSASPALDGAVLALAAALAHELPLGADATPDLLSVGLPATARIAQRFGPSSEAACLQLLSLDRDIGDFLALLDRSGKDYAVVLRGTAGSSISARAPLLFWRAGMAGANRAEQVSSADLVPTSLAILGLDAPVNGQGRCLPGISGSLCLAP